MEERIRVRIGTVLNDNRIDILSEDGDSLLHDLCRVIEQELDRAREEGYQKGWEDGSKGKVFEKVTVNTEVDIPKELLDSIGCGTTLELLDWFIESEKEIIDGKSYLN